MEESRWRGGQRQRWLRHLLFEDGTGVLRRLHIAELGALVARQTVATQDLDIHEEKRLSRIGKNRANGFAFWLLAPAALFYLLFQLLPILIAFLLSLFSWNGISLGQLQFMGLQNYVNLFHDPIFAKTLINNLVVVGAVLIFQVGGGFFLAVAIYAGIPGGRFYRRLLFVPIAMAPVAIGVIGIFVFSPDFGILDAGLKSIGLSNLAQPWLGSNSFALPAVIATYIFQNIGLTILLFLAALQQVNPSILEAARVDGARPKTVLWNILAPNIRAVSGVVVLLAIVSAFRLFDVAYVLTDGGPYYASSTLVLYLYDLGFTQNQVGYADAVGVVLFLIIIVFAAIQLRIMRAGSKSER
ncbi:MAG: carbohydrate ABC transporter permease [Acidimicrobiales bacterium]